MHFTISDDKGKLFQQFHSVPQPFWLLKWPKLLLMYHVYNMQSCDASSDNLEINGIQNLH